MKWRWFIQLSVLMLMGMSGGAIAEGYLFSGQPTYEYLSDELTIGIQTVEEDEVTYFIADIRIQAADRLQTAKAAKYENIPNGRKRESVSAIAKRHEAILAINADNFISHNTGVIIRGGEVLRTKNSTRHLMAIDSGGNLELFGTSSPHKPMVDSLLANGVTNTFEFGPILVQNSEPAIIKDQKFKLISTRESILEPRTAIGQLGPLHYLIIVVDGRREGYSKGISLQDLQQLFLRYGAVNAFNLDGGGSTTLYFNGEVINRPAGGKERGVSDILYFN